MKKEKKNPKKDENVFKRSKKENQRKDEWSKSSQVWYIKTTTSKADYK